MSFMKTVSLAVCLLALAAGGSAGDSSIVTVSSGTLKGYVDATSGKRYFAGIPFAQPPLGDLRWKAPLAEDSWDGVRNATRFQASCYQGENAFTVVPFEKISEDCLYLNVYTPPADNSTALPVMIFFYGGSWDTGSGSSPLYWGEHLVTDTVDGVILVTINYRLNVFGFLGGEVLRDADADGSTGNWGVLDQRRAMAWVQENIAAFGGDPSQVTIFGESAGAGSVSFHLTSPRSYDASPKLFRAAAMESGSPGTPWNAMNMSYVEYRLSLVAEYVGCLNADNTTDVDCLRSKPSEDLYKARSQIEAPFLRWAPAIDGVELTDEPYNLLAQNEIADVPVLFGSNADEGTMFVDLDYDATEAEYESYIIELMGKEIGEKVIVEYPYSYYNEAFENKKGGHGGFWAAARACGDGFFTCPARRTARGFANKSKAYLYFFNHTLDILRLTHDDGVLGLGYQHMGAFHGSELPFVFSLELALVDESEEDLSLAMGKFWSTFAQKTVPSLDDPAVAWDSYSTENDSNMNLATPIDSALFNNEGLKSDKCDFWDTIQVEPWSIFGQI